LGDQIKKNEIAGERITFEDSRVLYRVLVAKLREKRPLGRLRRRWEDNIKIDFQSIGWGSGLDLSGPG
jgi:hypothetical protein